jgi:hypothetical protein
MKLIHRTALFRHALPLHSHLFFGEVLEPFELIQLDVVLLLALLDDLLHRLLVMREELFLDHFVFVAHLGKDAADHALESEVLLALLGQGCRSLRRNRGLACGFSLESALEVLFLIDIDALVRTTSVRAIRDQAAEGRDATALRTFGAFSSWILGKRVEIPGGSIDAGDMKDVTYNADVYYEKRDRSFPTGKHTATSPSALLVGFFINICTHQTIETDATDSFRSRFILSLVHIDL